MAKILVHTAFNLTITPSLRKRFEVGVHQGVPLDEAEHWYTLQHATLLSKDDETPVETLAPDPLSEFQRDAAVARLLHLFRTTMLTLTDEQLMRMLADAEQHAIHAGARAADAGYDLEDLLAQREPSAETEGGEEETEVVPAVAPVEPVEPIAEGVEPVVEQVAAEPVVEPTVEPITEPVEPIPVFDPTLVEAMTDDELRAYIKERDGKAPHHNLGRDKLVALALAPAAGETAEPEQVAETEGGEA
jgi:hypothetical protein